MFTDAMAAVKNSDIIDNLFIIFYFIDGSPPGVLNKTAVRFSHLVAWDGAEIPFG